MREREHGNEKQLRSALTVFPFLFSSKVTIVCIQIQGHVVHRPSSLALLRSIHSGHIDCTDHSMTPMQIYVRSFDIAHDHDGTSSKPSPKILTNLSADVLELSSFRCLPTSDISLSLAWTRSCEPFAGRDTRKVIWQVLFWIQF